MNLAMAVRVNQLQIREVVLPPALLRDHMMHMEVLTIFQMLVANWADALLTLDELSATIRRHLRLGPPLLPVLL